MSEFEDRLQAILGDPQAMGQIMSIAQSISGGTADPEPDAYAQGTDPGASAADAPAGDLFSALEKLDPRLLQLGMRLISEYNSTDDRKQALLAALQPFVAEKRHAKMDQAIRIAKLAHVIRIALDAFRGGDPHLV